MSDTHGNDGIAPVGELMRGTSIPGMAVPFVSMALIPLARESSHPTLDGEYVHVEDLDGSLALVDRRAAEESCDWPGSPGQAA